MLYTINDEDETIVLGEDTIVNSRTVRKLEEKFPGYVICTADFAPEEQNHALTDPMQ